MNVVNADRPHALTEGDSLTASNQLDQEVGLEKRQYPSKLEQNAPENNCHADSMDFFYA